MKLKLAEALLRRKELNGRVDRLAIVKNSDLVEMRVQRIKVSDSLDDVKAQVPHFTPEEINREYDFAAQQLRLVDAAIQQANWMTEIECADSVMEEYHIHAEEGKKKK